MADPRPQAMSLQAPFVLSGDLSLHALPARLPGLLLQFDRALSGSSELQVDLSGLGLVDTSSLALLLELSRRAKKSNRPIAFQSAPAALRSLARLSSVDALLAL